MTSRHGGSPDQRDPIALRAFCGLVALVALLAACGSGAPATGSAAATGNATPISGRTPSGQPGPATQASETPGPVATGTSTGDSPAPRTVIGTVTDSQGRPMPGVNIWVETQLVTAPPGKGVTGPDGRYVASAPVLQYIYRAHAWNPVRYLDQDWCLQVAPSPTTGSGVFAGKDGAVRDFVWRLSGPVEGTSALPDEDGAYWGGTIRLFGTFSDGNYDRLVQLTLTPVGPLVDGSTGETLTRTVDLSMTKFALDIPLGDYRVSAASVGQSGGSVPLLVAQSGGTPVNEAEFRFKAEAAVSGCGSGGSSTGISRGFLDVILP